MIILVIYNVGVAIFKAERYPPICLNSNGPCIAPRPFQSVQFQCRKPHALDGLRSVKEA